MNWFKKQGIFIIAYILTPYIAREAMAIGPGYGHEYIAVYAAHCLAWFIAITFAYLTSRR